MRPLRGVAIVVAMLAAAPVTASAATRYATASGSGFACSQAAPCGVKTAIENAANGDTVELAADEYNLVGASPGGVPDYKGTIQVTASNLTIKGPDSVGDASTHVPFLLFSGNDPLGARFLIDGAAPTIRNIAVSGTAIQSLVGTGSGNPAVTLDRVLFLTSSDTPVFEGDNATITNSVFRQTGTGAFSRTIDITGSISNSFVYSANSTAIASINSFHKPPVCSLTIRNTIAWGKAHNLSVSTTSNNPIVCTSMSTNYDYSWIPDVASAELGGGIQNDPVGGRPVTISAGTHNLSNTPVVTNPAGAYEPSASSPAVNAGQAISDHDYYGRPRPIGIANDIGPYEATLIPEMGTPTVGSITSTTALASVVINPNGGQTTWNFQIRRAGESEWAAFTGSTIPAGSNTPVTVSGEANLLQPATDYQVRVVATNSAGDVETTGLSFRTATRTSVSVSSVKVKVGKTGAYFTSRATVSAAGSLTQTATTGSGRKVKTWCRTMTTARAAATYPLKCNLGAKGRRYLKKRSLALTVKTTLRAATGASATSTRKLTIKRRR